jgi:alkanesulfonate monooxygenase SsuD/methylene tetrahydromethanopterin reductase-like flavin-dependent oxidoreductase (luciferase family)
MRFGAFLLAAQFPDQDHNTVLDSTVAAALAAEEAGFEDVWVAEHHFMSYGIRPSAITLASYLLGATRRITVGTAVSVLSIQHPVALAEQAALLDQLSDGRSVLVSVEVARGSTSRCSAPA